MQNAYNRYLKRVSDQPPAGVPCRYPVVRKDRAVAGKLGRSPSVFFSQKSRNFVPGRDNPGLYGHVLVQFFSFLKNNLVGIGHVLPQALY